MKRLLPVLGMLLVACVATLGWAARAQAVTFTWSNDGDALSMDPYMINESFSLSMASNVYDTLVTRGKHMEILPALATSWKLKDPKTWVFTLRKGVKFQDGEPFTSEDVVFSYHRVLSAGSDLKGNFGSGGAASIVSLEAKGPYTVIITTKEPNPILLSYLTILDILSKSWCEKNGAVDVTDVRKGTENFATRHANGTGPFAVVSREADVKTVFKRNPLWWGWKDKKLAADSNVTDLVFSPIKQDATRVAALLSGDVDMIYNTPSQDMERIRSGGLKVYQSPELRTIYLGMDQTRPELLESDVKGKNPLKDRRVRLAMYEAIDEPAIIDKIMKGAATIATDMVTDAVTGFNPKVKRYPYDPEAAKKLLAEAGYPDGFSVGFDCPNDRYVNDALICQAVVSMWAKIGIQAKLLAQPKAQYFPKILSRNTSVYMLGWTPVTVDALDALSALLMTPNKELNLGRFNLGDYSDPKVDKLAQDAGLELNQAKRTRLLQDALYQVNEDVATIPLHYQQVIWASKASVDLVQRPDNFFEFWWVKVKAK